MEDTSSPRFSATSSQPQTKTSSVYFTGALIAFVIFSMSAGYYFFYARSTPDESAGHEDSTRVITEESNPVESFYETFSTKDYRIKPKHKLEEDTQVISYYQKGKLIRLDINGPNESVTIIFKDGKMYNLDHVNKTFMEEDENNPWLSKFVNVYKFLSIIDVLVMSETLTASPWQSLAPDPSMPGLMGYETLNREVNIRSIEGPVYVNVQIFVDPKTKLIMASSMTETQDGDFEKNRFTLSYEEVADMESLKQFPQDYKKQGLFDSFKFVPIK